MAKKFCFMDAKRPCDLTCKAAFEVDDPVDNIDCYFIWLSHHFGEGLFEMRRVVESMHGVGPGASATPSSGPGGPMNPPGHPGPKGPKGFSNN